MSPALALSALLALAVPAAAAPPADGPLPAELWVGAKAAYEAGEFERSARLYRQLLELGHDGGRLHYNLGNAYLRNGELGKAIAAYLRGRARLPRDEELRANLEFARQSARDAIAPPAPPALLSALFFWHYTLSRSELAWVVVALNLLLWISLGLRLWRPGLAGTHGLAAVSLLLLLAAGSSLVARHLRPTRVVVVVPQEVAAYSAPDTDSLTRFKLHAGSELRLRDHRDGWLRIALPDGEQGWIDSDWAEIVEY